MGNTIASKIIPGYHAPAGVGEGAQVVGFGTAYPKNTTKPEEYEAFVREKYESTPIIEKLLNINRQTGIDQRPTFADASLDLLNQPDPPSVGMLDDFFLKNGVPLAAQASNKAISDWGGAREEITHTVATTGSHSGCPGFDHFVRKELQLNPEVCATLVQGAGCAGGLAALRTAADIALAAQARQEKARILVMSCEIASTFIRSDLDRLVKEKKLIIGSTLFSDAASACIVSNNVGQRAFEKPVYRIVRSLTYRVEASPADMSIKPDPQGWRLTLSQHVPRLASEGARRAFEVLTNQQTVQKDEKRVSAASEKFDWAVHPGGLAILEAVKKAMALDQEQLRTSYETYKDCGNSSSATIINVLERLGRKPMTRPDVYTCSFGPGMNVEAMILRRYERGSKWT